jgi:hypothetical protein
MPRQRVGVVSASGAQRAGDRRGHPASHATGGHGLHEHDEGEDQGHLSERFGPQPADEGRLGRAHGDLDDHHDDGGRGQADQRGGNRALQQGLRRGRNES